MWAMPEATDLDACKYNSTNMKPIERKIEFQLMGVNFMFLPRLTILTPTKFTWISYMDAGLDVIPAKSTFPTSLFLKVTKALFIQSLMR